MKYINADKIRNAIESEADNWGDTYTDCMRDNLLTILDSLQQEQPDFPTTNEEIEMFLATHPKVELPNKYKTPDWLWNEQEQPKMNIPSAGSGAMGTTPPKFKLDVKQDLPVGLEKEIQEYLEKLGGGHGGFVDNLIDDDLTGLALHFYELGLKAKKK